MARGTKTLSQCVDLLRKEIRASASPAQGQAARPGHVALLQRTQEWLWETNDWAFLRIYRDKVMQAGSRHYSYPTDLTFEQIRKVEFKFNGLWCEVEHGIDSEQYNVYDPDLDERQDPVLRWSEYEDNQIEVWPTPATNGTSGGDGVVRFWGLKPLNAFIADNDTTTLDHNLIVLFAAAEILSGTGQKDANAKLTLANNLLRRLTGKTKKSKPFILGGGIPSEEPEKRIIVVRGSGN